MVIKLQDIFDKCRYHLKEQDASILYTTARDIKAKTILEIGGGRDGTGTMILGIVAKEFDGTLYSIEPQEGGSWEESAKHFGIRDNIVRINEKSPTSKVHADLDYLFIDGDHSTAAVIADFSYYYKYVRNGGRVAFHDYNDTEAGLQVRKAIDIITKSNPELKLIAEWNGVISCGIQVYESRRGVVGCV